ncbi:MAG: GDP-L-fucose synthase [Lachnospiraceae bacterium]|nr:GDP-L-fucose synthase [Lachnospiraceae bacterium]
MEREDKIYIAGHKGMVGSAIHRKLLGHGFHNFVLKSHKELNLTDQRAVEAFFAGERPDYVFLAAARVGGIAANIAAPVEFLLENLQIQCNVISSAYKYGVKKLMFLGSSCIYPKDAPQPLKEEYLMTGLLEPTNEGYAVAKITGLKLCEYYRKQYGADFISVMPCNLYGYYDNFDPEKSHIVPGLIRRFHEAKVSGRGSVAIWGSGRSYRELLFADEMADACVYLMEKYSGDGFVNIGYGKDYTVMEIAEAIRRTVGYEGEIITDPDRPEGMQRKVLDTSKLKALGWTPRYSLEEGLRMTYEWYVANCVRV